METMTAESQAPQRPALEGVADRLAALLRGGGGAMGDTGHAHLEFEPVIELQPLPPAPAPPSVWAVDGGQATVVDARCLSVVAVMVARAFFAHGAHAMNDQGPLQAYLLGRSQGRAALSELARLGLVLAPETPVDAQLLRDAAEWDAARVSVEQAGPGEVVLVDGDLQPDWRIPGGWVGEILATAQQRGVVMAGVTKHSGLSRGGVPLVAQLEAEAEADPKMGERSRWWAPVATTAEGVEPALVVSVARLDPAARFAFRVDLPATLPEGVTTAGALGLVAALADDAAFPGYPYPLSVVDGLAACPPWFKEELRLSLDAHLERAGVGLVQRERCFADRHRLMERA